MSRLLAWFRHLPRSAAARNPSDARRTLFLARVPRNAGLAAAVPRPPAARLPLRRPAGRQAASLLQPRRPARPPDPLPPAHP